MDAHAATSSKQAINRLRSHMLSITDRVDATSTHMHGDDKTSLSLSLSFAANEQNIFTQLNRRVGLFNQNEFHAKKDTLVKWIQEWTKIGLHSPISSHHRCYEIYSIHSRITDVSDNKMS
jgi:predicted RNA-binding protein with RPS1 domain